MIVDSSALIAAIRGEPDADAIADLLNDEPTWISAGTVLETSIVLTPASHRVLDELLRETNTSVVPFDHAQALAARDAYARFGKGSGSPARLNFGDCMAYALAKITDEPLLFKGDDFRHTDVRSALDS